MRINEVISLHEGVSFSVSRLKDFGGNIGKAWSSDDFGRRQMQTCSYCDGSGRNPYFNDEQCDICYGKGKREEWVSDAPELNVSNSNAFAIFDMLGMEGDYSGIWKNEQLPMIMKKLIRLKNGDPDQHTQDPSTERGKMRKSVDPDTGMTSIGRGPTMHDMGRSRSQVEHYVDSLMAMIQYAQKHNAAIGWG
jgi:hypothetical protein